VATLRAAKKIRKWQKKQEWQKKAKVRGAS
jgi:hypothetical protein